MSARWLWPVLGAVAYVAAVLLMLAGDPMVAREAYPEYSAQRRGPRGLSLARKYLDRPAGRKVALLAEALGPETASADAVVLRLAPQTGTGAGPEGDAARGSREGADEPATRGLLGDAEEAWVRAGGRLVIGLERSHGPIAVVPGSSPGAPRKVFPLLAGVDHLAPSEDAVFLSHGLERWTTVFARGERPLVSRLVLGKGDVWLLACPSVLRNDALERADHLLLLEALAVPGRPVLFDEYRHGLQADRGLLLMLVRWGLGPLLLVGCAWGALAAWRRAVALGPPVGQHLERRSEAVDLVDSLGALYERALGRRALLELWYRAFVVSVGARTGLAGAELARRAGQLARGCRPGKRPEQPELSPLAFSRGLAAMNEAFRRFEDEYPKRNRNPLG